jgi:hypothetical protein
MAKLFVDLDKRSLQLPVAAKDLYLALGPALLGRCSEALRDGPALRLISQSRMWPVTGIAFPMTMATRSPTSDHQFP